jgi:putative membrane protein
MTANDFIAKNITDNTHEVHLLQMGRDKGTDAQVKKAAAQMIVDHGQMLKDLQSLAAQRQVTVPAANTNMAHSALPDTKGKEFDQAWASQMVTMHEAKINELQNVLNQTQDPDIRALASKALPKIQKHRDMFLKITTTTTGSTQPQ